MMVGDSPESIVLVWITNGEHPDSPGVNLDQTEHFSRLVMRSSPPVIPPVIPVTRLPGLRRKRNR